MAVEHEETLHEVMKRLEAIDLAIRHMPKTSALPPPFPRVACYLDEHDHTKLGVLVEELRAQLQVLQSSLDDAEDDEPPPIPDPPVYT